MMDEQEVEKPKCIFCGATEDLEWAPDPYVWELYGDDTDVWECKSCRRESCADI